jgi:diacylglycerol kinase (ATP)
MNRERKFRSRGYHPFRKLKIIFSGLQVAVISDFSVAYKLGLSLIILFVCFAVQRWIDLTIILLATGMMLVAELINSAIEILCDFVEEQENGQIKIIKDIAAAAAGVSIFVWAAILILESSHLLQLL